MYKMKINRMKKIYIYNKFKKKLIYKIKKYMKKINTLNSNLY